MRKKQVWTFLSLNVVLLFMGTSGIARPMTPSVPDNTNWCVYDSVQKRIVQWKFTGGDNVILIFWRKASDADPAFSDIFGHPLRGPFTWDSTGAFVINFQLSTAPTLSQMRWGADGRLEILGKSGNFASYCRCQDTAPTDCNLPARP